jgi:hypothetical protein
MKTESEKVIAQCGCFVLLVAVNVTLGGLSVNYLLEFFLGKTLPLIGAAIIGLFFGEFTMPVAVVVWILKWGGIL